MNDPENGEGDEEALRARLEKLRAALDKREEERAGPGGKSPVEGPAGKALSVGFTVLSEFVAAVLVGAFIGWQADAWLGTTPFLLIVFVMLGVAAGFWNVYRATAPKAPSEPDP